MIIPLICTLVPSLIHDKGGQILFRAQEFSLDIYNRVDPREKLKKPMTASSFQLILFSRVISPLSSSLSC